MDQIIKHLFEMQDLKYRDFNAKLIPDTEKDRVIGVRTPDLRKYAKELIRDGTWELFLAKLPHSYHEENALHGYILGTIKTDYETLIGYLEKFLPYVDNWVVCDTISPKLFQKYHEEVYEKIKVWVKSDRATWMKNFTPICCGWWLTFIGKSTILIWQLRGISVLP